MPELKHWTERSVDDFLYKIYTDFVQQIESYLSASGENRAEFARKLDLSPGRISQVLNAPGNPTLRKIIEYARAAGKKVAVVAYDDNDPENTKGLVNSQVFEACWNRCGQPADFFALQDTAINWVELKLLDNKTLPLRGPLTAARGRYCDRCRQRIGEKEPYYELDESARKSDGERVICARCYSQF